MRFALRPSMFFLCLSLLLFVNGTTFAVRSIDRLIEEARTAKTKDLADEKLDQADRLLDKTRRIDDIERDFLRADIKQIRGRIHMAWAQNLGDIQKQNEAYDLLLKVSDDYEKLVERCENNAGQKAKRQRKFRNQRERSPQSGQNAMRARYKWAWAEYYVADASNTPIRQARFNNALEKFGEFTSDGDPNHIYVARCFNGQAHCLYELKRYSEIVNLLDPEKFKPQKIKSTDKDTIREVFKNTTLWRMKACQEMHRHKMTEHFAKQYFDSLPKKATLDAIELEMVLSRIRSLAALANEDESVRSGINEMSNLIKSYGVQWCTRLAEELERIGIKTPYWYLNEANKHLNNKNFGKALDYIEDGLKETNADDELKANLRRIKFVALWKLNHWRQAHLACREFLEHHPVDNRAAEVCSWGVKSGLEALKSDPPLETESFLNFLGYAEDNFPENSEAEKIPWFKGYILYLDGRYSASKKALDTIEPNSPVYLRAQHCLAMASYKQAEAIMEVEGNKQRDISKLLGDTVAALCRFADSSLKIPPQQELQLTQNAVELAIETSRCLMNLDSPDPNLALKLLDRMQTLQDIVHQYEERWLAQRIKADILAGNIKIATGNVEKLLNKATNAKPLIDISKLLERTSAQLTESGRNTDAENVDRKLVMIYKLLLDDYINKSTDDQMRANEASARLLLARCYQRINQHRSAIEHYEWYLNNLQKSEPPDVIRSVAIAYEQTNNYNMALPHWRKLFGGLNKKTNEWIEAAYHLINCHAEVGNVENARKVLDYFKILCPQSELGQWRLKFQALDDKLSTTNLNTEP